MKIADFDFRIVKPRNKQGDYNSCGNDECICNTPFLYGNEAWYRLGEFIDRDDASIEIWSGFHDKNGVLIYEGDILLDSQGDTYIVSIYDEFRSWILLELDFKPCCSLIEILREGDVEVLGNIHENADLLDNHNKEE